MSKKYKIGFIGNFEVPYSTENDRAWSFEKLGHKVIKFQENKTSINDLMSAINGDDAIDVLFYSHTHGWLIPDLYIFFQGMKMRHKRLPTVSVHLDRWAWLARQSDIGNEATWFTDYQFMADGSPEAVKLYEQHNLNWHWLKPGVVERDCYIAEPNRDKYPHDIIFVGSKGYHPEYPSRPALIDFLQRTYGSSFGHYGGDGISGTIRGHELNVLYSSAKVVVGDSCFGDRPRYWSDRVTETIGRGGFLIHPANEGLEIPGMAIYQHGDLHGLKQSIDYWLENDQERTSNKFQAHEHVKKYETYTNRAEEMLNIIFKENHATG